MAEGATVETTSGLETTTGAEPKEQPQGLSGSIVGADAITGVGIGAGTGAGLATEQRQRYRARCRNRGQCRNHGRTDRLPTRECRQTGQATAACKYTRCALDIAC